MRTPEAQSRRAHWICKRSQRTSCARLHTYHGCRKRNHGKGDGVEEVLRLLGESHLLVVGEVLLSDDSRDDGVPVGTGTLREAVSC